MHPPQEPHRFGDPRNPRKWTTGLCGCTEDPFNCCITFCCPCITFGQIAEIVEQRDTTCAMGALIYFLLSSVGFAYCYSFSYRVSLRAMFYLPEEPCCDFCVHCCCACCALCQEFRELKNRGYDPAIGWVANLEKINKGGSTVPPNVVPSMHR